MSLAIEKGVPIPSPIKNELEAIRRAAGGLLKPQDVVERAKDPNSALHDHFEWDDSQAAEKYRLQQARDMISVVVEMMPNGADTIRTYVSLSDERGPNGGYRHIVEVMNDEAMRETLLRDALKELQAFQRKYDKLKDCVGIGPVFSAISSFTETASH